MGGEMTYDEILRLLQSSGGTMQQADPYSYGGAAQSQAVALPDGRTAFSLDDGSIVVAQRTPDGQFNDIQTWAPGANAPVESRERFEPGRNFRRSLTGLAGILSLPLGVSALQSAGLLGASGAATGTAAGEAAALAAAENGILGSTVGMQAGTAAGEAAALAAAENGILGSTVGMQPGTAAAYTTAAAAPAAASAATGTASGFVGEGMTSGVPQWDSAASNAGLSLTTPRAAWPSSPGGMPDDLMRWVRENAPWLAPLVGATAAVAGNDDITNTTNTSGRSSLDTAGTSSLTGNTSTSSQSSLAPWLDDAARRYVARSEELASAPSSNASMDTSRDLLTDYATTGTALTNAAKQQQQDLIAGNMLNANPYIDGVAKGIADRMGDAYATGTRAGTFSRFNNDGNSVFAKTAAGQQTYLNDRAFGDSVGQTMRGLYYGNFRDERAAQDAAAARAPAMAQFDVNNARGLYDVGTQDWTRPYFQNQTFGQSIRPEFGSQQTGNNTMRQSGSTTGSTTGTTTGTTTQNIQAPSNAMAAAGGALTFAQILRMMNGGR